MNEACAYAEITKDGYVGKFRVVWGTEVHTVQENGAIRHFRTSLEAECAAWRAKHEKEYPALRREGDPASAARTEAEKLFPSLQPIRKNGKVIEVTRRRKAA